MIDRWRMTPELRQNLEDYLHGNFKLRPAIAAVTLVDSAYADPIVLTAPETPSRRRVASRVICSLRTQAALRDLGPSYGAEFDVCG